MAASLGNATVNVLARTVLFEQSLKRSLKRMSLLTAGIFAGVAAANFFGGAIKDAASLELRVARIKTLLEGVDAAGQSAFDAKHIRNFSNEIGISADKVAEAVYYMIGSGVSLENTYDAVRAASNVAVSTNTDLKFSSDFVSTALNALGGTVDRLTGQVLDSTHATDIFFAALKEGKGEPRELAQFISTAVPAAKALGVSYGEVNAAMAAGTLLGTKARKVSTGLSYIMRGLGNDTKGVGKVFKEVAGKDFQQFVKEGGTLQDAIKKLGTEVGMSKISNIGGAETGLEAIKLLLTVWPQYVAIQKEVAGASGDANRAVDTVNKTLSRQVDILQNKFKNFRGSVGDWLGPVLYDALAKIQAIWPQYQAAWKAIGQIVVDAFQMVGKALGPAMDMIKNALMSIDWEQVTSVLQAVWTGIMAGLTPLIAVIGGLIYAFAAVLNIIQPVVAVLNQMKPIIVGVVAGFVAYKATLVALIIVQKAQLAIQKLQAIWTAAVTAAQILQIGATSGLAGAWTALTLIMSANPIGAAIAAVVALTAAFVYAWKNSETFREIVVGVFNTVKDALVTGVSIMWRAWTAWIRGILEGIKGLATAYTHLPKILGGGDNGWAANVANAADFVLSKLSSVQRGIDSLHDKDIHLGIQVKVTKVEEYIHTPGASGSGIFGPGTGGSIDIGKNGQSAMNNFYADQAKNTMIGLNDSINKIGTGGGGSPSFAGKGAGGSDAKKAAKDKAKAAADAIKAALKQVATDLAKIAKDTSEQSVDEIRNNFAALYEDLKDAGQKGLIKGIQKTEKQLVGLADKLDKLRNDPLKGLDQARKSLQELRDESLSYMDGVKTAVRSLGDVADSSKGIRTTFTGIRNQLNAAIQKTKQFTAYVQQLKALGLNQTSLKQIVDAGVEGGMDAARTLYQSGSAGVSQINNLQGQLDAAGQNLANTSYNTFFANGIHMAEGLVAGLESQEAALVKAMDKMADALVASLQKKLKIKSPSRVFGDVGENISKGLAVGILDAGKLPQKAAANVGSNIVFGAGSVQVNGVSDPYAARKAGILSGEGITQVLERRRTAAALGK